MKREHLKHFIKELRATADNLQSYYDETKRKHRKLDDGNGTYDPIEYWIAHTFIHAGLIHSKMNLRKTNRGANHKGKKYLELDDGSRMCCYKGVEVWLGDEEKQEDIWYDGL